MLTNLKQHGSSNMTLMNNILCSLAVYFAFLRDHVLFVVGTKFIGHLSCPGLFVSVTN